MKQHNSASEQTDKLKDLFREMKLESTSQDFMKNLMLRIEKETVAEKHKKQINQYMAIAAGIIGVIGIPAIIIILLKVDIPLSSIGISALLPSISSVFSELTIDPKIIILCLIILFLLIGDTLFRKKASHHI